ncbi:uncharacterized protein DS421_1g29310 [Arachis hypogaea]|nr:uncharacterized protein DS421_1g29310 [Arachis hypogaea]
MLNHQRRVDPPFPPSRGNLSQSNPKKGLLLKSLMLTPLLPRGLELSATKESIPKELLQEKEVIEEVTYPAPTGPDPQIIKQVNIILYCLNHHLENINNDANLKVRLINALAYLSPHIPSDTHSTLSYFIEDVYVYLSKIQDADDELNQSIEALAKHDTQLKKCEKAKSQVSEVLSEARTREQQLPLKIANLEKELADLKS